MPKGIGYGARFKKLVASLSKQKKVKDAKAVSASIGRKKYGKKRFQQLAAKGRKAAMNVLAGKSS